MLYILIHRTIFSQHIFLLHLAGTCTARWSSGSHQQHFSLQQPHCWVDGLPRKRFYHRPSRAAVRLLRPVCCCAFVSIANCFKLYPSSGFFWHTPCRTKAVFFVLIIYYWNFEKNKLSCISHTCITPDLNKSNEQVTKFIDTVFQLYSTYYRDGKHG